MANPVFLGVDLSSYTLSSTNVDAAFPLTNLQTYYADDVAKSAASSASPMDFVIDFGSAKTCDCMVLGNYSFAAGVSTSLDAADDSAFTTNLVSTLASPSPVLAPTTDPAYFTFSSTSRRWWRLRSTDTTPPFSTQLYIGNWFLGSRLDFGFPENLPFKARNRKYVTSEATALDGRLRSSTPFQGRKTWEMDIALVSSATLTSFQTFMNTVRGRGRAFYFLESDGTTLNYVNLDIDLDPSQSIRANLNDIKKIVLKSQLVG